MEARGGISNNKQNKFLTCLKGGRYYLNEPDRIQISEVKKILFMEEKGVLVTYT